MNTMGIRVSAPSTRLTSSPHTKAAPTSARVSSASRSQDHSFFMSSPLWLHGYSPINAQREWKHCASWPVAATGGEANAI